MVMEKGGRGGKEVEESMKDKLVYKGLLKPKRQVLGLHITDRTIDM